MHICCTLLLASFIWIRTAFQHFRYQIRHHLVAFVSAGVGRTGTYIATDYLLRQARAERAVNVHGCVEELRTQRQTMVQTLVRQI